jgi:PAS domain S-box-containing protein
MALVAQWLSLHVRQPGSGSAGEVIRSILFLLFGAIAVVLGGRLLHARDAIRPEPARSAGPIEGSPVDGGAISHEPLLSQAQLPEENPNPVLRLGAGGHVHYANRPGQAMLDEPGGGAAAALRDAAEAVLRTSTVEKIDVACRDGRLFSFACIPVRARGYVNLYGRDVTEERRKEIALRENDERLRQSNAELDAERARWQAVVEGIADEVWICDRQGQMSLLNLASVTAMGLEEFRDRSVDEVLQEVEILTLDGQPRPPEAAPLLRSLRGEIDRGEEIMRHRRTGRSRYRQFASAPLRDATGTITGAVAVVRDITEHKQAEQEIVRLNLTLVQRASELEAVNASLTGEMAERRRAERELEAAKLSAERAKAAAEEASRAKDHFLAVLSHELRTPLTPVLTGLSLLEMEPSLSERGRQYLEVLRRNVELESRLIDDLLDLTRIARGKVELDRRRIELCTIIDRAVEVCRPDIEARGLHFDVDFGPRPYVIEADAARLQQVFWNLIKNAIKFTPHGGSIGVRCRPEPDHVVVDVTDSGIGIEPPALVHIFDAFAQAERSITRQFGGLGLGLAISKALVEMHGGSIEAHSEGQKRGATFRVRLPVVSAAARVTAEQPGPSADRVAPGARRARRILLVEDHGDTADMIVSLLELDGHVVHTAGDVATALEEAVPGRFDLLISDLGLPDGSGLDLIRALRSHGHDLPAIALSGYGQEHDVQQSRAAGFQVHLVKPIDPERLLETVQAVVARGASA